MAKRRVETPLGHPPRGGTLPQRVGIGNPALVTPSVVLHQVGNGGFVCCLTLAEDTCLGTFPQAKHLLASSKQLEMGNSQLRLAAKFLKKTLLIW